MYKQGKMSQNTGQLLDADVAVTTSSRTYVQGTGIITENNCDVNRNKHETTNLTMAKQTAEEGEHVSVKRKSARFLSNHSANNSTGVKMDLATQEELEDNSDDVFDENLGSDVERLNDTQQSQATRSRYLSLPDLVPSERQQSISLSSDYADVVSKAFSNDDHSLTQQKSTKHQLLKRSISMPSNRTQFILTKQMCDEKPPAIKEDETCPRKDDQLNDGVTPSVANDVFSATVNECQNHNTRCPMSSDHGGVGSSGRESMLSRQIREDHAALHTTVDPAIRTTAQNNNNQIPELSIFSDYHNNNNLLPLQILDDGSTHIGIAGDLPLLSIFGDNDSSVQMKTGELVNANRDAPRRPRAQDSFAAQIYVRSSIVDDHALNVLDLHHNTRSKEHSLSNESQSESSHKTGPAVSTETQITDITNALKTLQVIDTGLIKKLNERIMNIRENDYPCFSSPDNDDSLQKPMEIHKDEEASVELGISGGLLCESSSQLQSNNSEQIDTRMTGGDSLSRITTQQLARPSRCQVEDCEQTECVQMRYGIQDLMQSLEQCSARGVLEQHGCLLEAIVRHYPECDDMRCPVLFCRFLTKRAVGTTEMDEQAMLCLVKDLCIFVGGPVLHFTEEHNLNEDADIYTPMIRDRSLALPQREGHDWNPLIRLGSFGNCILAITDTRQYVVIKEMTLIDERDDPRLCVFRALMNHGHPNVVQILWHKQRGRYFQLAMEAFIGFTMADYLSRFGALGERHAVYYLQQILLALQFLHENNVIYLNLEDANVLLNPESGCHIKITNFSTSVYLSPTNGHRTNDLDITASMVHPCFIPPELLPKDLCECEGCCKCIRVCPQSDIWMLGCLLYQMITGHTVREGLRHKNRVAIWNEVRRNPVPALIPQCSDEIGNLFVYCWQLKPEYRVVTKLWACTKGYCPITR